MFLTMDDLKKDYIETKMIGLKIDDIKIKELRPAQEKILEKFVEALNQNKHLLVQAPNGCGKTLAYSLVAGYLVEEKRGRVLIVCPTKDLQKQVSATCSALGLNFIELYGSEEYTCPLRSELLKIGGDNKNVPVVTLLCKHLEKCPYLDKGECEYFKSQELGRKFPLVITNYNKYLSSWDMLTSEKKFDLTIFDEAHNLEPIAEESSMVHISSWEIKKGKEYFQNFLKEMRRKNEELVSKFKNYSLHIENSPSYIIQTLGHFEELVNFFEENRLSNELDVELHSEDLKHLVRKCKNLANALKTFSITETLSIVKPSNMLLTKLRENLTNFAIAASKLREYYLFKKRMRKGDLEIVGEPQIRGMVRYILDQSTKTQCHVSATLGNMLDYAERIGALKQGFIECNITDYPFDITKRVLLALTDGPPMRKFAKKGWKTEYSWEEKKKIANRILEKLLLKWFGNTLIFFRSREEAADAYEYLLKNPLLEPRLLFKKYFENGKERKELIDHFKKTNGSVLFGYGKMDQGLDLPGESLTLILTYSLPFVHRTSQMWKDLLYFEKKYGTSGAFEKVDLAVAAKRLSQLIGRLIRTENDFGIMVVIDRRFYTRFYNWMKGRNMLSQDISFKAVSTEYACRILDAFWEKMVNKN